MTIHRTMRRIDPDDMPTEQQYRRSVSLGFWNSQPAESLTVVALEYLTTFNRSFRTTCRFTADNADGSFHLTMNLVRSNRTVLRIKPVDRPDFVAGEHYWKFEIVSADYTSIFVDGLHTFHNHSASMRSIIDDLAPRLRSQLIAKLVWNPGTPLHRRLRQSLRGH